MSTVDGKHCHTNLDVRIEFEEGNILVRDLGTRTRQTFPLTKPRIFQKLVTTHSAEGDPRKLRNPGYVRVGRMLGVSQ